MWSSEKPGDIPGVTRYVVSPGRERGASSQWMTGTGSRNPTKTNAASPEILMRTTLRDRLHACKWAATPESGVLRRHQGCPGAPRWAPWPTITPVTTGNAPDDERESEEHGLNRSGRHDDALSSPVPEHDMGHVDERGPALRPGVEHLEYRLEITIQVNERLRVSDEFEWLVPLVPPAVHGASG